MYYQPTDEMLRAHIEAHFDTGPEAAGWRMTNVGIMDHLRSREVRLGDIARAQEMQLARVLQALGVRRVRSSKWRGYEGIRPK